MKLKQQIQGGQTYAKLNQVSHFSNINIYTIQALRNHEIVNNYHLLDNFSPIAYKLEFNNKLISRQDFDFINIVKLYKTGILF